MSPTPKPKKAAAPAKDTIYIDVEDEITAVIDKMSKSDAKVIALVLPKRATTMQSVVNLKLLKRAAETHKKNIVLITSDASVVPLAGIAGLHVAKTLQSKPAIPITAVADADPIMVDSDVEARTVAKPDPVLDPKAPIGALAGDDDTIEVGDTQAATPVGDDKDAAKKKNRKLVVPNFDKFRIKLIIGGVALLLLIVGWILAAVVLPRAHVVVATDTAQVNASAVFEAKADQQSPDIAKNILPAYKKELKKTSVEKVPTTGKRDDGDKATGTLTLTNCIKDNDGFTVPAGTTFSASGLNYITSESVTLSGAVYQGSVCKSATFGESETVKVAAETGGSKYNLSARGYSVPAAYTSAEGSMLASGSDMAGGTSKQVSVVAQSDIESAKQQALDKLSQASSPELRKQFTADQAVGLETSLENQPPTTTSDPEVGKEATEVSVTVNVTYTMYGVKRDGIVQLIEKDVKTKIDTNKQSVQNTGIDQADIRITDKPAAGVFKVSVQTTAVAGPQFDIEAMRKEIAGKRRAQAQDIIKARPGVTDVTIKYSPFWVWNTPKQANHINITFTEANAKEE